MGNRAIYINETLTLYERAVHHQAHHHNSCKILCEECHSWPDVLVTMLQYAIGPNKPLIKQQLLALTWMQPVPATQILTLNSKA